MNDDEMIMKFRDDPDCMTYVYTYRVLLNPMSPASVVYFKKAITEVSRMDTTAYLSLFNYYMKMTHEYAKAFEVINQALLLCHEVDDLMAMFDERQALLQRVIKENFWSQL